jgi:hypothetical protein
MLCVRVPVELIYDVEDTSRGDIAALGQLLASNRPSINPLSLKFSPSGLILSYILSVTISLCHQFRQIGQPNRQTLLAARTVPIVKVEHHRPEIHARHAFRAGVRALEAPHSDW